MLRVSIASLVGHVLVCACDAFADWRVPRSLYTFWEGPRPELVEQTLATWSRFAPGWDIQLVTRDTLSEHLDVSSLPHGWEALTMQQLSDLVRLEIVAARGGVWLDASVVLAQPLASWVPEVASDGALIGFDLDFGLLARKAVSPATADWETHFYRNGSLRPIADPPPAERIFESWGFAAPRGCPALRHWRDEFRRAVAADGGVKGYCDRLLADSTSSAYLTKSLRAWLPYLTVHATLARMRHAHPEAPITSLAAETMAFAHLDYAVSWPLVWVQKPANYILDGTGGAMLALGRGPTSSPPPPSVGPLLKLRNLDRAGYSSALAYRAYASDSPLAEIFFLPPPPRLWPVSAMRYLASFDARFGATDDMFLMCTFGVTRFLVSVGLVVASCMGNPLALLAIGLAVLLQARRIKVQGRA